MEGLISVEIPIKHHYRHFPTVKKYTTLPDGTKHGKFIKEGKSAWSDDLIPYEERFYSNGKRDGKCSIWMLHQGQVYDYLQINNYSNGLLHGEQVYYEVNSWTAKRWEQWEHGTLVSVFIKYKYEKGYTAGYTVVDGRMLKHGVCKTFYLGHNIDKITLKTEGEWYRGKRVGVHREYARGIKHGTVGELIKETYHCADDLEEEDSGGYEENPFDRKKKYKIPHS